MVKNVQAAHQDLGIYSLCVWHAAVLISAQVSDAKLHKRWASFEAYCDSECVFYFDKLLKYTDQGRNPAPIVFHA